MSKKFFYIAGIAALIVVVYSFTINKSTPTTSPAPSWDKGDIVGEMPPVKESVVTYTEDGFVPAVLTIKNGEAVVFKNASSRSMWTATAMHPTHRGYNGTSMMEHCPDGSGASFDACRGYLPGESWSFTFRKVGTWPYHDHLNSGFYGKILVIE